MKSDAGELGLLLPTWFSGKRSASSFPMQRKISNYIWLAFTYVLAIRFGFSGWTPAHWHRMLPPPSSLSIHTLNHSHHRVTHCATPWAHTEHAPTPGAGLCPLGCNHEAAAQHRSFSRGLFPSQPVPRAEWRLWNGAAVTLWPPSPQAQAT